MIRLRRDNKNKRVRLFVRHLGWGVARDVEITPSMLFVFVCLDIQVWSDQTPEFL